MKLSMFKFNLPKELLAEHPAKNREDARMMVLERSTGKIYHKKFKDVINYFDDGLKVVSGTYLLILLVKFVLAINSILERMTVW